MRPVTVSVIIIVRTNTKIDGDPGRLFNSSPVMVAPVKTCPSPPRLKLLDLRAINAPSDVNIRGAELFNMFPKLYTLEKGPVKKAIKESIGALLNINMRNMDGISVSIIISIAGCFNSLFI